MNPSFWIKWLIVFILVGVVYLGATFILYTPADCGVLKGMYQQTTLIPTAHAISFEEPTCILDIGYRSFGFPAFVINQGGTLAGMTWSPSWTWYPGFLVVNVVIVFLVSFGISMFWQKKYSKPTHIDASVGM